MGASGLVEEIAMRVTVLPDAVVFDKSACLQDGIVGKLGRYWVALARCQKVAGERAPPNISPGANTLAVLSDV